MARSKKTHFANFKNFVDIYLIPKILYNDEEHHVYVVGKKGPFIDQDYDGPLHWIEWWGENFTEGNSIFKNSVNNKNKRFKEINYSIINNEITISKKTYYPKKQKTRGEKAKTSMPPAGQAGNKSLGC